MTTQQGGCGAALQGSKKMTAQSAAKGMGETEREGGSLTRQPLRAAMQSVAPPRIDLDQRRRPTTWPRTVRVVGHTPVAIGTFRCR